MIFLVYLCERIFIRLVAYTQITYSVIGNDHFYLWFQLNWKIFCKFQLFFLCLVQTTNEWNEFQLESSGKICLTLTCVSQFVKFCKFNIHFQCAIWLQLQKSKSSPISWMMMNIPKKSDAKHGPMTTIANV